jgi:RNA polymerase sigma factor (sigma-70 family)
MSPDPKLAETASVPADSAPAKRVRLDELAQRYYRPLQSFFRKRTRNAPEVHDLVQQVFLRLAQHGELSRIENADGYIFQTAANTLKDHYRHEIVRERFAKDPSVYGVVVDSDFPTERVLEGRETLAQVVQVLRRLPERTRDIVVLRCFEGLKYAEIARLHGISVRAVEKHMAKALTQLSQQVDADAKDES